MKVQYRLLLLLLRLVQLLPLFAALAWSCYPALCTVWAAWRTPPQALSQESWQDYSQTLALRRQLQKHFLNYSVYIPLEDIHTPLVADGDSGWSLLMQKACGQGKLLIWLPFKFNLPIAGEKVLEWCWKPQTKDV